MTVDSGTLCTVGCLRGRVYETKRKGEKKLFLHGGDRGHFSKITSSRQPVFITFCKSLQTVAWLVDPSAGDSRQAGLK